MSVIGTYFQQKMASGSEADEDDTWCKMLATEMRKVTNNSIKRCLKRKLLEACFQAQEQQEELQLEYISVVMCPTGSENPNVAPEI